MKEYIVDRLLELAERITCQALVYLLGNKAIENGYGNEFIDKLPALMKCNDPHFPELPEE